MANQSLAMLRRRNMAANNFIRYPDDPYDRYWWPMNADPAWANLSTTSTIKTGSTFAVPSSVLQTAVTPSGNSTVLNVISWQDTTAKEYVVYLHFADFQSSKLREFDAYPDANQVVYNYTPHYLLSSSVYTPLFRAIAGEYNITLAATANSALPPMLNAFEIYFLITYDGTTTFSKDFDAIMAIKLEYGVKKNWMGDPCFPPEFAWDGIKCRNTSGNIMRIISLDLSNSNLFGVISNNFTLLTALENLNLSGNQLNGPIPDSLCKNNAGQFVFRYVAKTNPELLVLYNYYSYGSDGNMCNKTIVPAYVSPQVPDIKTSTERKTNPFDPLQITESRQFTYEELKKFTNNFQQFIGRGGFGNVYYGCLENKTEVAVKMLSEFSENGLDQFLAEVQSLTKVHHKNLVSLVGYCWEKDHLALAYEYMARGNLCDHLRGKFGVGDTFNWVTRVRVVLDAAQGLEYLHKGCNLPIIHGDVKTNNVLLGENLKAKIADFGLSKTYISETQTHISTSNAAGTMGYIDPEYYHTGRLTESSDVYSFGVVLLEVTTGEPPILPGSGHIIQRVKQKVASGNISLVADARLKDSYDISSMWKVVDTAMLCISEVATQRPTMSTVVLQLKESLALEEARDGRDITTSSVSDAMDVLSKFGPSAR
uniref:Protein kinase domain-containing protein n=1 Tax=Oryza nivara TaxID=4536 RepID=A0A0E0II62_ORYNI